ncbi:helix-turn-helix domain-containing protein [Thiolinea disciformis]|uniref:helix-turn-helix domain-containing protein n=1 Tax=Thiolinea disciformis TaxID=125614 RepID=UPI000366D9EB|nr:helix-turn-helix domain-containing protein [Thiolinea disciformis]
MTNFEQQAYQATRELVETGKLSIWDSIIRQAEMGMIKAALALTDGNQTEAALLLQKNRCTLRARMGQHQLR